jgi:hypothetical protein
MKLTSIIALFLLISISTATAQITNTKIKISDEQDKVTITYDLARNPRITFFNIKVNITLGGETVNATGLSGDLGPQVAAGFGKKIIWDVAKDLSELSGELKLEVTTDTKGGGTNCRPINAVPAYAGLGSVGISGLGLIITGLSVEGKSKDLYDIYKNNISPTASVYSELSRDEHYAEANKKHKLGSGLLYGGTAVLVVGGAAFITRAIKIKNYNRKCAGLSSAPERRLEFQPRVVGLCGIGVGIGYTF